MSIITTGLIATREQTLTTLILGIDDIQFGSRFSATIEASSYDNFKQKIIETKAGYTHLTLKNIIFCQIN